MASLSRLCRFHRRAFSLPSLSLSSTSKDTEPNVEKEQEEAEVVPEENTQRTADAPRYQTNTLMPHLAFLFPAKPRVEHKRFHLRSLRRSKLSTAAHLHHQQSKACLWCGTEADGKVFFCPQCNKMLPVEYKRNPFDLFDLKLTFDIDVTDLETKYKQLQMQLHPDKFATKEQKEQDLATARTAAMNKAYQKLRSPLDRGKCLLRLKGFPIEEQRTINDPVFLMEMLEIQERISEMKERDELLDILAEMSERQQMLERKLSETFADEDLPGASEIVTEMTYLQRILAQTKEKL